ncbi:CRISPR-associated protein, Csy4 family [Pseudomonas chlororaphis subsp. aurantiaca]|uniref:Type I-F CRISPR-associated endoribonuclease Cas6/Csy4 n=1 Tax=Pseudomonas chlororaphis subsp. aurantiaca TaxID=86192 RepID=A0AAJ0ZKA1_9PSED|nr:type I-F CRISPR-associated endoribonuclease Cas6/Csy4 [Pseudomonas chlororaphis]AZD24268.1 CRISPR-associated protein, Csy4 family [Pseudomonas chlororaphis subsp. aurantiaca]MBU4634293.1 type I-F CRISPR-associated endoribonuclease Cas6/Csy4 [Pseudomonas chlororaphis subsp. aurantiaca]
MDHYIDLKLLPDPEFAATQLMSALLAKLHRGLHDLRRDDIGISFPGIERSGHSLGSHLRLHGSAQALASLLALNWLTGMRDHVQPSELRAVPSPVQYRHVSRVQIDSNPERTRRRLIKRHGITEEEARQRIPDHAAKRCDLPFANLRSHSNGQTFRLFVRHGPLLDTPQPGSFGSYGLSTTATIPWF